jgi:hypothetical protein
VRLHRRVQGKHTSSMLRHDMPMPQLHVWWLSEQEGRNRARQLSQRCWGLLAELLVTKVCSTQSNNMAAAQPAARSHTM